MRSCLLLLALAWLLAGCQPTPATQGERPLADSGAHEEGRRIYNFRCYYCHGYAGDAKTLAAQFLSSAPRDFTALAPGQLSRDAMIATVREGRAGTPMAGFGHTLTSLQIERVVDFVREEFMARRAPNTRYHTAANGWPDHGRYAAAYPFATGALPLDRAWEDLTAEQAVGKRLYLSACISCHDRSHVTQLGEPWGLRGVSFPEGNYEEHDDEDEHHDAHDDHGHGAAPSDGDPYELHETPPTLRIKTPQLARGEALFQKNCAHCHAADGSGRNWIGSFLDPVPPDFTRPAVAARLERAAVAVVTRDGLRGTSMPAWKDVLTAEQIDAVAAYVETAWGRRAPAVASAR